MGTCRLGKRTPLSLQRPEGKRGGWDLKILYCGGVMIRHIMLRNAFFAPGFRKWEWFLRPISLNYAPPTVCVVEWMDGRVHQRQTIKNTGNHI